MSEREYSAEMAVKEAQKYLERFSDKGVVVKVKDHCVGDEYPIYSVFILKNNKLIIEGHGKGIGLSSLASAYCESVEHFSDEPFFFLDDDAGLQNNNMIKFISYENFFSQENIESLLCMNSIKNLKEIGFDNDIPCVVIESLLDKKKFFFPFALLSVNYPMPNTYDGDRPDFFYEKPFYNFKNDLHGDYDKLYPAMKYSTTTGCASGLSLEEAVLHGILEIIERDAMSIFMLEQFYNNNNNTRRILPEMLSVGNRKIFDHLYDEYGDVLILDVTSDIGIPAITAYLISNESDTLLSSGQGCSLSFDYAIERALLELKQSIHIVPKNIVVDIRDRLIEMAKKENIVFYQKAFTYNPIKFIDNPILESATINKYKNLPKLDVSGSLKYLLEVLKKYKFDVFIFNRNIDSKITCVKVIIPGMEDLSLVGHLVIPGDRGISFLKLKGESLNAKFKKNNFYV